MSVRYFDDNGALRTLAELNALYGSESPLLIRGPQFERGQQLFVQKMGEAVDELVAYPVYPGKDGERYGEHFLAVTDRWLLFIDGQERSHRIPLEHVKTLMSRLAMREENPA